MKTTYIIYLDGVEEVRVTTNKPFDAGFARMACNHVSLSHNARRSRVSCKWTNAKSRKPTLVE